MISQKTVPTYWVKIFVGLQDNETGITVDKLNVYQCIREYCNEIGFCVTVTPTEYIYSHGFEEGFEIGAINYPRFPKPAEEIWERMLKLGLKLLLVCKRCKVSIMDPNKTLMITNETKSRAYEAMKAR